MNILYPESLGYKSKDYRRTSDGIMVADIGFKKQLWALDPELDVVWDPWAKKWEIWRFPGQKEKKVKRIDDKAFNMMTVQTKDRTFRELGADILLRLQQGDPTRYSLEQLVAYFDQMDDNIKRAKEKAFRDKIEAISRDTFSYIRNVVRIQVPKSLKVRNAIVGE